LNYDGEAFLRPGHYMRAFTRDIDPEIDLTAAAWVAAIAAVKKADIALWDYLAAGNTAVCLAFAPFIDAHFVSQIQASIAADDDRLLCVAFLEALVTQVHLLNNISELSVQLEIANMAMAVHDAASLEQTMIKIRNYSGLLSGPAQVMLAAEALRSIHATNRAPSETGVYMLKIESCPDQLVNLDPLVAKLRTVRRGAPPAIRRAGQRCVLLQHAHKHAPDRPAPRHQRRQEGAARGRTRLRGRVRQDLRAPKQQAGSRFSGRSLLGCPVSKSRTRAQQSGAQATSRPSAQPSRPSARKSGPSASSRPRAQNPGPRA
jgi:hypothetical protein